MVQKFYDELAYGMEKVLADEEYQKIFAKPKIKTASAPAPEPVKLSADGITDTFKTIVTLSAMLDDMGYEESASQLLRVAQGITDKISIEDIEGAPGADQYLAGLHPEEEEEGALGDLLRELAGGPDSGHDQWKERKMPWEGGDANDAMDKPTEDDKEEGNPEC